MTDEQRQVEWPEEEELVADAYELDDPKHPTYRERMADYADHARKAERENA